MNHRLSLLIAIGTMLLTEFPLWSAEPASIIEPRGETIRPFNGKDLTGFTTWLRESDRNANQKNYSVKNGMIHISGEGMGYMATVDSYKNYHLSIEYKWGKRTDGSKYVRNSGILLHATGPPGNARGVWMASIEVQLAQGCEGDLIVIRGKDEQGKVIPVDITSDTIKAADGRTRLDEGWKENALFGQAVLVVETSSGIQGVARYARER